MINNLCPPSSLSDDSERDKRIIAHESKKQFAYTDSQGYTTIGIGRNIDSRGGKGLTDNEIMMLFRNDINECKEHLETFTWYNNLDLIRKGVLIEMRFNLGPDRLLSFKKMISALQNKDFNEAVTQMKDSKWATQIGKGRLDDLCNRMLTGKYT